MSVFTWGVFHQKANKKLADAVLKMRGDNGISAPSGLLDQHLEDLIKQALEEGAQPNRPITWKLYGDTYKDTALNIMVFLGNVRMCQLLLDHGARLTARANKPIKRMGRHPLFPSTIGMWSTAIREHVTKNLYDPSKNAILNPREKCWMEIGHLLVKHPSFAELKRRHEDWADQSLLDIVGVEAEEKAEKYMSVLLDAGADINRWDNDINKPGGGRVDPDKWKAFIKKMTEQREWATLKPELQKMAGVAEQSRTRRKI